MRVLVLAIAMCVCVPDAPAQKRQTTGKAAPPRPQQAPKKKNRPHATPRVKAPVLDLSLVAKDAVWCDRSPRFRGWSADGKTIYYSHAVKDRAAERPVYAFDVATRKARRLTPKEVWALPPGLYPSMGTARRRSGGYRRDRLSPDRKLQVFTRTGDIFLREVATGKERRLTATADRETGARFAADGKRIFFVRAGNFYALGLETGQLRQLTELRKGPRPKPKKPEEQAKTALQKALVKQQQELFKWIKERRRVREARRQREKRREKFDAGAVRPFYTPDGSRASPVTISPDGRFVVVRLSKAAKETGKPTVVPTYVTESGFVETSRSRTKVGEPLTVDRYGILHVKTAKLRTIDPEALRGFKPSYRGFGWSPDGKTLAALALAQDYRTRWVLTIDPTTAQAEVVDAHHDPAWIGGPAWSSFGWLKDSRTVWFVSEATGYAHLYCADRSGRFRKQLTRGAWEVQNVRLSWTRDAFELVTNEKHPGERHLYVMAPEGGERRCLTASFPGLDDAAFSPDGKRVVVKHSTPTMPAALTLLDVSDPRRPPRVVTRLFRGATDRYLAGRWIAPRVVHFADRHGNRVYARLYVPEKPHQARAAVVYVHGAGYAQSAHKRWGRAHTYLFGQYLLKKGYYFLDLDYRGSAGYGRDCRTEIYRYMGGTEVDSGAAAVDFLVQTCRVDRNRVGIFGGSYGGFYTLMALFTRPGLFKVGVALYPVTDWAHYNHWYTSRILNLPQEDREAYRRSSPIYLAANLKDRLQIQHGAVDSNVHFQDTMRLVERLIELGKTGWDVATYPVESHGWRTEASRLDSYRRMAKLFDEVLLQPGIE